MRDFAEKVVEELNKTVKFENYKVLEVVEFTLSAVREEIQQCTRAGDGWIDMNELLGRLK